MTIISVHGGFFGAAAPAAQIEAMIAAHIPRKHIVEVADVYGSKWWDYRRLAPGHSFYLFAHHYYKESRTAAQKFVRENPRKAFGGKGDRRDAYQFAGPALVEMQVNDIWDRDQGHLTGLWNAMLVADALGIPYDVYVRLACRIAIDTQWKRIPRPSQLYSEKMGAMVADEWDKLKLERLPAVRHPHYLVENYEGLPLQDEYRAWLIECLSKLGSGLVPTLSNVVYTEPQLPVAVAEKHFPAHALTRARLLATA